MSLQLFTKETELALYELISANSLNDEQSKAVTDFVFGRLEAFGASQAQPDPREMYQMLQCMQAGEMSVSRGVEILEMWQAGNYAHDCLPPCGEILPDDKMPWDVIKGLREQLAQAQQTTAELPEPAATVYRHPDGRRRVLFPDSVTDCDASWQPTERLHTATQMQAHYQAGVKAGMATVKESLTTQAALQGGQQP